MVGIRKGYLVRKNGRYIYIYIYGRVVGPRKATSS